MTYLGSPNASLLGLPIVFVCWLCREPLSVLDSDDHFCFACREYAADIARPENLILTDEGPGHFVPAPPVVLGPDILRGEG